MNAVRSSKKAPKKQKPKPAAAKSAKAVTPKKTPTKKVVAARPETGAAKAAGAAGKAATSKTVRSPAGFSLEPIYAAIRKRVPAVRQAEAQAFAEAFYKRMVDDEYPHHEPETWAAIAVDMLDFARSRKPGTANVRVFNATLKANGWEAPHTVLQIVNDDMPFLVDSVSMALAEMGVGVHVLGHPLVRFTRDKAGKATAVGEGKPESLIVLEIDRQQAGDMPRIEQRIRHVLEEVRAIVRDWGRMREKMLALADDLATRRLPISDAGRHEAQ